MLSERIRAGSEVAPWVVDEVTALERGERSARGRIASVCETIMQCVMTLEKRAYAHPMDQSDVSEVCKKLRAAVLAAT